MHDLVIFDCDGVLVDSEPVSNRVLAANLMRHGLAISVRDCMAQFVGGSMRGVMAKARDMGADLPDNWLDEIYGETYGALRDGVALMDGVTEVLAHLDSVSVPYCVASNGSHEKMQITLGQNGLWDRFGSTAISAHKLGVGKPQPDVFLAAAAQFSAQNPIVIEDSRSGAIAARRAGFRCLGYCPQGDGAALQAEGADPIRHMSEVIGYLDHAL